MGRDMPEVGTQWRHLKRGSFYQIVAIAELHAKCWDDLTYDIADRLFVPVGGTDLVIYRSLDDGKVWARPLAEFMDGRFERVGPAGIAGGPGAAQGATFGVMSVGAAGSVLGSSDHPRTLDGMINNCALNNGNPEGTCQICGGECPERPSTK